MRVTPRLLLSCAWVLTTAGALPAQTVHVRFYQGDGIVSVPRDIPADTSPVAAAVEALVAGPTLEEAAQGIVSSIPAGTKVVGLDQGESTVSVDLSDDILVGFDEHALQSIFMQFRATLGDFPEILSIRLTCHGVLLADYLAPAPMIQAVPDKDQPPMITASLSGRKITIGPSHGRFWNGSGWYWQRSDPCGFGEAVLEDTNSIRLCQFLYQYLTQDGAIVHVPRELNENTCCHSATGLAWWKMAARYWLQHNGLPSYVWDSSTSDSNDDIRARPLFADYRGTNIYIACHTNAGGGTGTETFRDTAMAYPAHEAASYTLATAVNTNVVNAIREMVDSSWANRGVKDSNGGFGEIRIPNQPAILIELAFHDHCTKDGVYLKDNFFRSVAEWGLYKGVCQYFGTTPTWDKYSCELVSNTIPSTMTAGQVYNVNVVMRNRGVVWSNARSFRLGAVGDSDPFTSFNRVNISGEVRPGATYTFSFQMTAPAPGTYTSDWRMVRDGVTWFGPTLTKTIQVIPAVEDNEPPSTPTNLVASAGGPTSVQLNWTASTDNIGVSGYDIRRNGAVIATSGSNSYVDNTVVPSTSYTYEVRARDASNNTSGWSNSASVTTPPGPVVVFSDGFNGNLNNWTQTVAGFDYSTAVNHGTYPGSGAARVGAGESDQMAHVFDRPFAGGKVSGWFWDSKGGWKSGTCGNSFRQSLSLRDINNTAAMIIDNEFYSPTGNQYYCYRTVGSGGVAHTAYGTRDPATDCNGTWVYFETTVTPGAPGSLGTLQLKVTDRAGTSIATPPMTSDFYSHGIGRITLGLGVSSTNEGWWDDIAFEATAPGVPSMGTPVAESSTSIRWVFSPADNNLFGYEVADAAGAIKSPQYPATGWLTRTATSWTEEDLLPNTQYTRKVRAWNGTLNGAYSEVVSAYTLSAPPTAGSVVADSTGVCPGQPVSWTAVGGFGPGKVSYYRYVWNQLPTHQFTGNEPIWSEGTLEVSANAAGAWYLHVQGFNAADVPNGTYDYLLPTQAMVAADFDADCDVDTADYLFFESCLTGPDLGPPAGNCRSADLDGDDDVDQEDFGLFQRCLSGTGTPAEPTCMDD